MEAETDAAAKTKDSSEDGPERVPLFTLVGFFVVSVSPFATLADSLLADFTSRSASDTSVVSIQEVIGFAVVASVWVVARAASVHTHDTDSG